MAQSIVSSLDLERGVSPEFDQAGFRQPPSPPSLRSTSRQTHYSRPLPSNPSPVPRDLSPKAATYRTASPHSYSSETNARSARSVSHPTAVPSQVKMALPSAPAPVFSAPSPQPPLTRARTNTSTSKLSIRARSVDLLEASKLSQQMNAYDSVTSLSSNTVGTNIPVRSTSLRRRVFEAGSADLLYDLTEMKGLRKQTHGVLDLTTLEKMSVHILQAKLTEQVRCLGEKRAWLDVGIEKTLHDYCNAVRDLDFMEQCASRGSHNDPFLITTSKGLESKLLEDADLLFEKEQNAANHPASMSLPAAKRETWTRQRLTVLLMALAGGMALIGPFLIMTLIEGEVAKLVTTCGFMVIVALTLSVGSECSADKVALITAAYSAALVIFAGNDPPSLLS